MRYFLWNFLFLPFVTSRVDDGILVDTARELFPLNENVQEHFSNDLKSVEYHNLQQKEKVESITITQEPVFQIDEVKTKRFTPPESSDTSRSRITKSIHVFQEPHESNDKITAGSSDYSHLHYQPATGSYQTVYSDGVQTTSAEYYYTNNVGNNPNVYSTYQQTHTVQNPQYYIETGQPGYGHPPGTYVLNGGYYQDHNGGHYQEHDGGGGYHYHIKEEKKDSLFGAFGKKISKFFTGIFDGKHEKKDSKHDSLFGVFTNYDDSKKDYHKKIFGFGHG